MLGTAVLFELLAIGGANGACTVFKTSVVFVELSVVIVSFLFAMLSGLGYISPAYRSLLVFA